MRLDSLVSASRRETKVRVVHGTLALGGGFYVAMPDFPIDPELRIRGSPPRVLRRTTEAMAFIQKMTLSRSGRAWRDVQQSLGGLHCAGGWSGLADDIGDDTGETGRGSQG
jgi:hypothetical protein